MKTSKLLISALLVVVVGSLFVGTVTAMDASPDEKIDETLSNTTGENVDVVVRFGDTDRIGTNTVSSMKKKVEENVDTVESFAASSSGVEVNNQLWLANAAVATIDTNSTSLEELASLENVERVHPNFEVSYHTTPEAGEPTNEIRQLSSDSSTLNSYTYGLEQINAPQTWQQFDTRGEGTKVAVLDTGVNVSHPDIDLYPGGWAEFDKNGNRIQGSEPRDTGSESHGTHVSGTVAGGNESGTAIGVAPEADLMHAAVLTNDGTGTFSQITAGLQWAVDNDAEVVSMSLGSEGYEDAWIDPVRNAQDQGVLVVASSGNSGSGTSGSPGNVYDALSVGATDEGGDVPGFSGGETIDTDQDWGTPPSDWPSRYTVPDVVAPGSFVESAVKDGGYSKKSGTSMAAPHVSGAAALIESSTSKDLSPDEIKSAIIDTANNPFGGTDSRYGSGILDTEEAASEASEQDVNPPDGTGTAPDCSTISYDGEGTETNPYEVTDVLDLQCIADSPDTTLRDSFIQMQDINAIGTTQWNNGSGFEPIADFDENERVEFDGTYDGNGYSISGLEIDRQNQNNTGLFGAVEDSARIRNVTLEDSSITGRDQVGALVGFSDGGTIMNSSVIGAEVEGSERVAGLVGRAAGSDISGSVSQADITRSTNELGVFVGLLSSSNIKDSNASGTIDSPVGDAFVGGFVGRAESSEIEDSEADVDSISISGHAQVGGFVGFNDGTNIEDSGAEASITLNYPGFDDNNEPDDRRIGGFVGYNAGGIANSTANGEINAGKESSWVGGFVGKTVTGNIENATAEVDITAGPYSKNIGGLLGNLESTTTLSMSSSSGNITANDSTNVGGLIGKADSKVPDSDASGDVLSFDTVNNADITNIGGLVGSANAEVLRSTASGDVLTNDTRNPEDATQKVGGLVGSANANVTRSEAYGNVTAEVSDSVGGLVGSTDSYTVHSFATGRVTGYINVGGLVGSNTGTVSKSNSTGTVSARGILNENRPRTNSIGGLVGSNSGTVTESYSDTDVLTYEPGLSDVGEDEDPETAVDIGGLVGDNTGDIINSYSVGDVNDQGTPPERQDSVGGLIGGNGGKVEKSFAAGTVDGFINRAGLVGLGSVSLPNSTYWDKRTTTQDRSVGVESSPPETDAVGLGEVGQSEELDPTDEMTGQDALENMPKLDFNSTWKVVEDSYPDLAWEGKNFRVEILNVSDVGITGTVKPKVRIESDARISDQQTVVANLTPAGEDKIVSTDTVDLNLSVSESVVETFELNTTSEDIGPHTVKVSSDDTSDTAQVNISSEPNFAIETLTTNSPIKEGDTLEISADIANLGGSDQQTVVANLSGTGRTNETNVSLGPVESTSETFTIDTLTGDANGSTSQYKTYLRTENDTASKRVGVAKEGITEVSATNSNIGSVGNTSKSFISVRSDKDIVGLNVTVSTDTDGAKITDANAEDVGDTNIVTLDNGTARFRYFKVRGAQSFSLGSVTVSMVEDVDEVASVDIEANVTAPSGFLPDPDPGTLRLGDEANTGNVFTQPLIASQGFVGPPSNTGQLHPVLYEDLNGDGDGVSPQQTVDVFGALIRGDGPQLTEEQGNALDWNGDGPELTIEDLVTLFGEQIRSG